MLRLKGVASVESIENESAWYLIIKVVLGQRISRGGEICYWSSECSDGSLIEIGIKKLNGVVYEITVPIVAKINLGDISIRDKDIIEKNGLPLFHTKEWLEDDPDAHIKGYYARKNEDFEIYAGKSSVSILFSNNEITLRVVNGPIAFCFDKDGYLCIIQMMGMRLNEEGFLEQIV